MNLKEEVVSFLRILGLDEEYAEEYLNLFASMANNQQTLMQQIFLPTDMANKFSYLCEHWGEEFNPSAENICCARNVEPSCESGLIKFEQLLRRNNNCFNYPEKKPYIKEQNDQIIRFFCPDYTGGIQARLVLHPELVKVMRVKSYYFDENQAMELRRLLSNLIKKHAEQLPKNPKNFTPAGVAEIFYKTQKSLRLGYIENIDADSFLELANTLSLAEKREIHRRLINDKLPLGVKSIFSFSNYILGYTYYDLLLESVQNHSMKVEDKERLSCFIRTMANSQASQSSITESNLSEISRLLNEVVEASSFSAPQHSCLHEPPVECYFADICFARRLVRQIAEGKLWAQEPR